MEIVTKKTDEVKRRWKESETSSQKDKELGVINLLCAISYILKTRHNSLPISRNYICKKAGISQSTFKRYIKILKSEKFIEVRKGPMYSKSIYTIREDLLGIQIDENNELYFMREKTQPGKTGYWKEYEGKEHLSIKAKNEARSNKIKNYREVIEKEEIFQKKKKAKEDKKKETIEGRNNLAKKNYQPRHFDIIQKLNIVASKRAHQFFDQFTETEMYKAIDKINWQIEARETKRQKTLRETGFSNPKEEIRNMVGLLIYTLKKFVRVGPQHSVAKDMELYNHCALQKPSVPNREIVEKAVPKFDYLHKNQVSEEQKQRDRIIRFLKASDLDKKMLESVETKTLQKAVDTVCLREQKRFREDNSYVFNNKMQEVVYELANNGIYLKTSVENDSYCESIRTKNFDNKQTNLNCFVTI